MDLRPPVPDLSPLDNPALSALRGPQASLALVDGAARRYPPDVAPFVALPAEPDAAAWSSLARLLGPGGTGVVAGLTAIPPAGWEIVLKLAGVQMVDTGMPTGPDGEAAPLGAADVPEMLALVERTRPGPFLARTHELGTYLGIRRGGELVAMAGERMHPPGWTELSAVCTDAGYRGQGLGTLLMRAVAARIRGRGEVPFLHAAATNSGAIRLYETLGFVVHRQLDFVGLRAPSAP